MSDEIEKLREAGYEIEFVESPEEEAEGTPQGQPPTPQKSLGIGVNLEDYRELPDVAFNVAEFVLILQDNIGEFDGLEIGVNVGGKPTEETSKYMGFVQTDAIGDIVAANDEDYFDEEDEEYDEEEGKRKAKNRRKKYVVRSQVRCRK